MMAFMYINSVVNECTFFNVVHIAMHSGKVFDDIVYILVRTTKQILGHY